MLALHGRDKVTLITSPGIADFGAWLEQLLAESTGKDGKGLIPVDREPLGAPEVYGDDRLFVYVRHSAAPSAVQDAAVDVGRRGTPVVRIPIADIYDLGQEFFDGNLPPRWPAQFWVSTLSISRTWRRAKTKRASLHLSIETSGKLPDEKPFLEIGGVRFLRGCSKRRGNHQSRRCESIANRALRAHFSRISRGDYFALLAYIERNAPHDAALQKIRLAVHDTKRVPHLRWIWPALLALHRAGV